MIWSHNPSYPIPTTFFPVAFRAGKHDKTHARSEGEPHPSMQRNATHATRSLLLNVSRLSCARRLFPLAWSSKRIAFMFMSKTHTHTHTRQL